MTPAGFSGPVTPVNSPLALSWPVATTTNSGPGRVPWLTAATTGIGIRLVDPNGAASCAACSLGALAGKKALLLPCVTLLSDGR